MKCETGGVTDAPDDRQRLQGRRDSQEARVHGRDAAALPARRLHPGARGRPRTRSRRSRTNFSGNSILGFLNLFSGGSLSRLSLFALGIMPYITASIILQLLTVVVPSLERLQKEGEVGQQKITQYTRYLTVGAGLRPVAGLRVPVPVVPEPGGNQRRRHPHLREGVPDRDRPDRRHDAVDVAGRADHPARDRERDLADDLRLDRCLASQPGSRRGGRTRTRSSS